MKLAAFLRAINVAGHNKVAMQDLREIAESLGYEEVTTILQSGNVVLEASDTPAKVEQRLTAALQKALQLKIDVFVRTEDELRDVLDRVPTGVQNESAFLVMFMGEKPSADAIESLKAAHQGPEKIAFHGREGYIDYVEGIGRSKLSNAIIEKKLGVRGTGRNVKTLRKVLEKMGQ